MTTRIGGVRRKTRAKLQKPRREKGKLSIRKFMQKFNEGDKVQLTAEPAYQKGMYHPRFHGKTGVVNGTSGKCYTVAISDKGIEKTVIVHPVHLRKLK
ncbi:50S ribosomal protein L21e [Candidatus Woesearchaeota archaeon]|nr:50S ribosomal protein L21e [Candidatus Woesearchaeota archaeon]